MNETLALVNQLQPIAKRMRDRQEQIEHGRQSALNQMSEVIALAAEQGQDCLLVKVKLAKSIKWSEWLSSHVPNLREADASKYERISTEQISSIRQGIFAFLPSPESQPREDRDRPKIWETAWGFISKLKSIAAETPLTNWPQRQVALTRQELEPIAKQLWPEKFGMDRFSQGSPAVR